jgi:acid stress-induced BolA-like protein IbaG/YrbA
VLLGCGNIKDEGVKELSKNLKYLEDVDIGGTNVSGEALRDLVALCLNLKKVNITGCKRLNASDDNILKQHKINVEGGEDVFRFYLIPEQFSDLPRITNSVLKTRSTLSLHKVYKYLIKKLSSDHIIEEISDD